jgi:iron complex transport system substrate-binding protein
MKICFLLPSATEILFALGLGDQVAGVSHECDVQPEARSKPALIPEEHACSINIPKPVCGASNYFGLPWD